MAMESPSTGLQLPYPPSWLIYLIGILLLLGYFAATVLYFVNFPPQVSQLRHRASARRNGYEELNQDGIELSDLEGQRYETNSSIDHLELTDPGNRRQRMRRTHKKRIGLGINVQEECEPSRSGWHGSRQDQLAQQQEGLEQGMSPDGAVKGPQSGLILAKVGESIERLSDRAGGFLHVPVQRNGEKGLLLPVRDCERDAESVD